MNTSAQLFFCIRTPSFFLRSTRSLLFLPHQVRSPSHLPSHSKCPPCGFTPACSAPEPHSTASTQHPPLLPSPPITTLHPVQRRMWRRSSLRVLGCNDELKIRPHGMRTIAACCLLIALPGTTRGGMQVARSQISAAFLSPRLFFI